MEKTLENKEVRNKLIELTFYNIFDGIATFIGLELGFYIELNFLLSGLYEYNSFMFIIAKVIIPTILFTCIMVKSNYNLSPLTKRVLNIVTIIYFLVCIYHLMLYFILAISI